MLFKWFAYHIPLCTDLSGKLIISQRGSTVINRRKTAPLQRFRISKQTEIIQMPVFIRNNIIQYDHAVEKGDDIFYTESLSVTKNRMLVTPAPTAASVIARSGD